MPTFCAPSKQKYPLTMFKKVVFSRNIRCLWIRNRQFCSGTAAVDTSFYHTENRAKNRINRMNKLNRINSNKYRHEKKIYVQSSIKKEYSKQGPLKSQIYRSSIAIAPTCDDIWTIIEDNMSKIDISVFYTAMYRCIELNSFEELGNIYQFVFDSNLLPKVTVKQNYHDDSDDSDDDDSQDEDDEDRFEDVFAIARNKNNRYNRRNSRDSNSNKRIKNANAHIKLTDILFYGLRVMNEYELALEWLNKITLLPHFVNNMNDISKANVFSYLIELSTINNDYNRAMKIYQWLDKLNVDKTVSINCSMIALYSKMNDLDTAYQYISNFENNIESYAFFLKGLIYQQVSLTTTSKTNENNNDNNNNDDSQNKENGYIKDRNTFYGEPQMSKYLISANDIDSELIESLPEIIEQIYSSAKKNAFSEVKNNTSNINNIKNVDKHNLEKNINIKNEGIIANKESFFFSIFKLLSYYGHVDLCIKYYDEMISQWKIKPNIEIYNCLIAMCLNKTIIDSFFGEQNDKLDKLDKHDRHEHDMNESTSEEELVLKMKLSIDRVFSIYQDLKKLFIKPQLNTLKLIYRAIMGMIRMLLFFLVY